MRQTLRTIKALVEVFLETVDVDPKLAKQLDRFFAVDSRSGNRLRSAITNNHPAACLEFISAGMPAEVVVVVEDHHLRVWPCNLWKKYAAERPLSPPPTTIRSYDSLSGVGRSTARRREADAPLPTTHRGSRACRSGSAGNSWDFFQEQRATAAIRKFPAICNRRGRTILRSQY